MIWFAISFAAFALAIIHQLVHLKSAIESAVDRLDTREETLASVQEWTKDVFREVTNLQMVKTAPSTAPFVMRERRLAEGGPQAVAPPTPLPLETPVSSGGRLISRG